MKRLVATLASLASALLLAASLPASAAKPATQAPPVPPSFGEAVEVNVVNVDVYATDRNGHRVNGLGKDDFELLEDGKRVAISNFDAVGADTSQAGAHPAGRSPAGAAQAPEEPFNLVVYFDDFNIGPAHRARVLRQLGAFLTRLAPGDRVMLVTDDLGLHVRVPFTSDPAALVKGLQEVGTLAAHGGESNRERRHTLDDMLTIQTDSLNDPTDPVPCPLNIVQPAHAFAASRRQETLRAINNLTILVNSLSGVPGRKAILHVSDGLPITPGEELFQFLAELCGGGNAGMGDLKAPSLVQPNPQGPSTNPNKPDGEPDPYTVYDARSVGPKAYQAASQAPLDAQTYSVANALKTLAAHANAHRVTLYTLQASGLQGTEASDASFGPDARLYQFPSITTVERANNRDSLQLLADATGGRSILDANDILSDLARMQEDLSSFYSLGFTPAHASDGREHRIEARVKQPGLRLRYRQSYRDKPAVEKAVDRTLAALYYGLEDNPLDVAIAVGEAVPAEGGLYAVPVRLQIPLFKLAILNQGDFYEGKLRLLVATRDDAGGTAPVRQVDVPLKIPRKQVLNALGQYYVYTVTIRLKPGLQHIAVAVRDEIAASTSYLNRPLTIAATASVTHP
ncbi:MAG TPA: VWA domain-containing protein [Thermoanaerobaculia bacterium]|jgi:VWFA-related protein